ncbi:MAG: sodium:proton antiporter [Clostridiaceae bacterium]|jgi:Na+/H+-dicarboxylate symporter|nr:sodium:proton antiporter [Clostridiaceae bacterium]
MNNFLKTYKSSIILLGSVIMGGIIGIIVGPKASVLEPLGTLFINLMFTIIVPLVFFSVASSIAGMKSMKRLGKIMSSVLIIFTITALIASIFGFIGTLVFSPTKGLDQSSIEKIIALTGKSSLDNNNEGVLQQLVNVVTVSDFTALLSRKNMLQLIVFSVLFGVSTAMIGEKGRQVSQFLESATNVMMKLVSLVMYYAPIGLCCYFASMIGQLGSQILQGYLRVFVLYLVLAVIYYFGFFSIYAFVAGGKNGIKTFWRNAAEPSIMALATCSSAACIPVNIRSAKKMGVPKDIAETVLPLGANIHKDGSVFGGVMKVTFLLGLFGKDMKSLPVIMGVIFVSFLVGAVMGAIPNGGMIGEMLIIGIYGFSPNVLPIIAIISTIIDAPATVLNSTGNTVSSMMITRFVDGKLSDTGSIAESLT